MERMLIMANRILRLPEVTHKTGYSTSTIYLKVSQGTFPKPVSLGARAVGWLSSEIDEWIENCVRKSREAE